VEALRLACGRLFETTGVKRIVASLKPENIASIRLFEKARFVRQGDEWVAGHKAIKMILDRSHWPEIVEDT
jgi:RimJ/RimL family protein N-acetyltransferase